MFHFEYLLYIFLIHSIFAIPQINLYYTDEVSESHNALQHNCLHVPTPERQQELGSRMIPYCMSELSSKFKIEDDDLFPKFTFASLSKENITSYELYLWSAPIDLIERCQFYLNQPTIITANTDVFYNYTMPRFGPQCQYELHYHYSHHSSLQKIVEDFYNSDKYDPTASTCYKHIKCSRGLLPTCLDWREICDGQIDCLDGGIDEEYCWELEVNQCEDNEYRCRNGQCIPKSFYNDGHVDCIDSSDFVLRRTAAFIPCYRFDGPSVMCKDLLYQSRDLANSFKSEPLDMLLSIMYTEKDSLIYIKPETR